MQRLAAVWKVSPLKLIGALSGLVLAVGVAVGSGANFSVRTANPNNVLSAGNLTMSNSKDGAAVLTASRLKPGDSSSGTVDIQNTGDIAGVFALSSSSLTNTPSSPAFSAKLDLKVEDLGDPAASPAATPSTLYTGKLGSLPSTALGTWPAGEKRRYRFTVTFPDGGTGGADNAYRSASSSIEFDWDATS